MSQTLQNTSEMLQRSSANNKDLSQSISKLTQKLAVQNASDNTSSVKKQPASHNVKTTSTNLPTSNRFAVLADLNDSIQEESTKESRKILIMGNSHIRNIKTRYFINDCLVNKIMAFSFNQAIEKISSLDNDYDCVFV